MIKMKLARPIFYIITIVIFILANALGKSQAMLLEKLLDLWSIAMIILSIEFITRIKISVYSLFPLFIAVMFIFSFFKIPYHDVITSNQYYAYLALATVFIVDLIRRGFKDKGVNRFLILSTIALLITFGSWITINSGAAWAVKLNSYGFQYYIMIAACGQALLAYDLRGSDNESLKHISLYLLIWYSNSLVGHLFSTIFN